MDIISGQDNLETHGPMGTDEESYGLTWPGKRSSILFGETPTKKTLRPCRYESVDFDSTENLYIEGDNLDVLKLLQESYRAKIKMIYIDPPYNTGSDLVYEDRFFHADWLNMMYPRLMAARHLLTDDGLIFVSIDDNEAANLQMICQEIFGPSNHLGTIVINSAPNARDYGHIGKMHEYAFLYAKDSRKTVTNKLCDQGKKFKYSDSKGGFNIHPLYNSNEAFTDMNRPNLYYPFYLYPEEPIGDDFYRIGFEEKENSVLLYPPKSVKNSVQFVWRWGREKASKCMNQEIVGYKTQGGDYRIVQKMRHTEKIIRSLLTDTKYSSRQGTREVEELLQGKYFSFPKPLSLISDFISVGLSENDRVLDFFSGSATTAHAVMQLNAMDGGKRKYIMVQIPEKTDEKSQAYKAGYKTICEIGKERIRRAADKIKEENPDATFDKGFKVLKCQEVFG